MSALLSVMSLPVSTADRAPILSQIFYNIFYITKVSQNATPIAMPRPYPMSINYAS